MRKKSYKNSFIFLLIIAAIFVSTSAVFAAKPKKQKGKESDKKIEVAVQKEKAPKKVRTEITYTGSGAKRNPFAPPKVVVMKLTAVKLDAIEKVTTVKLPRIDVQGIIWSKNMPQVIINGTVMKAGDYIEEFQIKEVTRQGIILFHKGEEYLIKIQQYQDQIKKTKNIKKKIRSKK